jgi:NitT/TauT family transport system substrate-binding protein
MKLLISILFFIASSISFATSAGAPDAVTLALNWKAEPEFGGFYAAQLDGSYKAQNLNVKIQEGGSGTPTVQMLANGKVDFAIVSADELIISQDLNPNNKIKAIAAIYQKAPYIVMTHAERDFKSLKDVWEGSGILSMQSGLPYYKFLENKFGKPKVKVVPYLGGIGNFLSNKEFSQQGFLTTEPLSAEKAGAKVKNFLIADEGFNPYLVVLATSEETLKKNPELVARMKKAVLEGWTSYLKDPSKANQYMATLNKSLDAETFKKAAEVQRPLIQVAHNHLGEMTSERWKTLIDQLKALHLIKGSPSASDMFVSQ